jgi:hypothetical protein
MGHTVTKESRYYKVAPPEEESFIVGAGLTKINPQIAVTGLEGVRKTQLVLELAYQSRGKYKSSSVLWGPATNMESLHI